MRVLRRCVGRMLADDRGPLSLLSQRSPQGELQIAQKEPMEHPSGLFGNAASERIEFVQVKGQPEMSSDLVFIQELCLIGITDRKRNTHGRGDRQLEPEVGHRDVGALLFVPFPLSTDAVRHFPKITVCYGKRILSLATK